MKVEHMVWFKWNEGVSASQAEQYMADLRALVGKVPGIIALKCGVNFTDRARGFTHGLSVTLESREGLKVYADHPEHMAVATRIRKDAEVMAMDFEF